MNGYLSKLLIIPLIFLLVLFAFQFQSSAKNYKKFKNFNFETYDQSDSDSSSKYDDQSYSDSDSDSDSNSDNNIPIVSTCIDELDDNGINWATGVFDFAQGTRLDGLPVLLVRSDPENALGVPEMVIAPPLNGDEFFGPGYFLGNPGDQVPGGFVELIFGGAIGNSNIQKFCDVDGIDIVFQETTFFRDVFPPETAQIEVCEEAGNDSTCVLIGTVTNEPGGDGRTAIDIDGALGPGGCAESVIVTDFTQRSLHVGESCGYDIDGVGVCGLDPNIECDECDGKVTELTLKYLGTEEAQIKVVQKKDGDNVFDDTVKPGEEFTFQGTWKKGTLGTEIKIYVDDEFNTQIHTSCSQPIGPGLISGDFEVIQGFSRTNELQLCPVDSKQDDSDSDSGSDSDK